MRVYIYFDERRFLIFARPGAENRVAGAVPKKYYFNLGHERRAKKRATEFIRRSVGKAARYERTAFLRQLKCSIRLCRC
jgi:hypothetical protein